MSTTKHRGRESAVNTKQNNGDGAPFDDLAFEYDAWFENEGRTILPIEVRAFRELLPSLPKAWLEIGIGSGRFAQALGIR